MLVRCFAVLLVLLGFGPLAAADAPQRPNILLIYADDQSYKTVGCYPESWPWVKTPHLDALARMFVRLAAASPAVPEREGLAWHALHRDATGRPVLETWLVPGMGHAWSGGDPRGTHTYPPGPDATERMLEFLLS